MNENDDPTLEQAVIPTEPPTPVEPVVQEEPEREGMRTTRALLVAFGFLVVVIVLATPSLRRAIQRGKQERTMGDMRTIQTALENYSVDHMMYVLVNAHDLAGLEMLASYLEPTYVKQLPRRDAWDRGFQVEVDSSAQEYTITSFGLDGLPDGPGSPPASLAGETTDFRNDIVFSTGSFYRYPAHAKRH